MKLTTRGIDLHYDVHGSGQTLLLIHGFPLSGRLWEPTIERLSDAAQLIVPDLRGMGRSTPTPSATMRDYVDDLVALLDDLGQKRPVVLIGLSMGGYVAFDFVRRHSARVRGLVLVDTRAEADTAAARANRVAMIEQVRANGSGVVANALIEKLFAPEAPPALKTGWNRIMAETDPKGVIAALEAMADRPDSMKTLENIKVPTLIVVGEHDQITPPDAAREMAARCPAARLLVVPGAGHMTPVEAPDAFAEALRTYLDELDDPSRLFI